MSIHTRREVEVKLRLGETLAAFADMRKLLAEKGYRQHPKRIETDYLPDSSDGLLKKHGLLLRFREVEWANTTDWLLTLKVRSNKEDVLDFEETETPLIESNKDTFRYISQQIQSATGYGLNEQVMQCRSIQALIEFMGRSGFPALRILLDKYREEYSQGKVNVTLDYFPDGMGGYMEIETYSKDEIAATLVDLGQEKAALVTDDYGDILKEHKRDLKGEAQRRTALFTTAERKKLLGQAS